MLKIAILLAFIICFISCTEVYLNAKKTIAVIDTAFAVAKGKPEKNSCLYGITAMIFFTFNSSSRSSNICFSYIHYFIFILHRFITNRLNDQLPVGLLAQLVSQSAAPVSQRSRVQIQYKPKFFRLSFRNCKSCVYNCDDSLHLINSYC